MKMTEADVLPTLLAACPSFRPHWDEYVGDETYEPNQVYVDVGRFARHLLRLLQAGKVEEFSAVFVEVEQLLQDGDEDARSAVTTGLLEDLYFVAEDAGISPGEWRKYFGPGAARAWEAYLAWAKKTD
jgi:hypothetical protein